MRFGFPRLKPENKLEIKATNTIIERWPLALKLSKGDVGFDEELETLEASSQWGAETYVEWASAERLYDDHAITALYCLFFARQRRPACSVGVFSKLCEGPSLQWHSP